MNLETRLGGTSIKYDGRTFRLSDVHAPQSVVTIEDADTADLILFLFKCCARAKDRVKVEEIPK